MQRTKRIYGESKLIEDKIVAMLQIIAFWKGYRREKSTN